MPDTECVTVTLPTAIAESLRQRVASGAADSASGFVAEVLEERFREENLEEFLAGMEAARGTPVDDDTRARSAELMRLARGD